MKLNKLLFAVLISTIFVVPTAQAGLLYVYSRLVTKDLEQVNKLVQDKIKESRKSLGDKTIPLKEALQAVLSRPNDDSMIEKVIVSLKAELDEHQAWQRSIKALVKEALGALKNPKAFRPDAQVTYIIFLENLMAEFRPRIKEPFERSIFEQIKKAEIEISKEAKNERLLRMMKESESPSKIAELILQAADSAAAAATTTTTTTIVEEVVD